MTTSSRKRQIVSRVGARYRAASIDLKPLFGMILEGLGLDGGHAARMSEIWNSELGQGRWSSLATPELHLIGIPEKITVGGIPVIRATSMAHYMLDTDKLLAPVVQRAASVTQNSAELSGRLVRVLDKTAIRRECNTLGRWLYFDAEGTRKFTDPNFVYAHWVKPLTISPELRVPGYSVQRFRTRVGGGSGGLVSSVHMDTDFDLSQERGTIPKMVPHLPRED